MSYTPSTSLSNRYAPIESEDGGKYSIEELPDIPYKAELESYTRFDPEEMPGFWKDYANWFRSHGFTLYDLRPVVPDHPRETWRSPPTSVSAPLPFATRLKISTPPDYNGRAVYHKFALARDLLGRDVIIKITLKNDPEYRINEFLRGIPELYDPKNFPCVLPPIMTLDSPHKFAFLVTPHWGSGIYPEDFSTVREVVVFVECLLKALSFLHEHRIAHRDISERNILVNLYCPEYAALPSQARDRLRTTTSVCFSLFDFDLSLQLPRHIPLKDCRRPSYESWQGELMYRPPLDVSLAQPYYNPFVYDVGCLGMMFVHYFTNAIPSVPALAPLFARMTTYVLKERFTAAEALSFFDANLSTLSEDLLAMPVMLESSYEPMQDPDLYWSLLSARDRGIWRQYRVLPKSWYLRLLVRIAEIPLGWKLLSFVRQKLRI